MLRNVNGHDQSKQQTQEKKHPHNACFTVVDCVKCTLRPFTAPANRKQEYEIFKHKRLLAQFKY